MALNLAARLESTAKYSLKEPKTALGLGLRTDIQAKEESAK